MTGKVPPRVKGKFGEPVIRPATLHGMKTVSVTKGGERQMDVAEMKKLRFSSDLTRLGKMQSCTEKWRLTISSV